MTMLKTEVLPNSLERASAKSMPKHDTLNCDVLIIGAGLAGLSTALSLPKRLQVVVLAKADLTACSSHYAQGGIAAVIDADDSVSEHVSDTLIAGDGLCDGQSTTAILSQGGQAIEWLLQQQVPFTTNHVDTSVTQLAQCRFYQPSKGFDALACADLHLTQEGGHSRRRVAHADDATGRHIMYTLTEQALASDNINLLPFHEALSLLTTQPTQNQTLGSDTQTKCIGATVFDSRTHRTFDINSQAVVLASGGLGQLFDRATAPEVCVGDGMMMAREAGCRLANLEFIQFHPTGLVTAGAQGSRNFLISEAVRGEGGYLRDPVTAERFMPSYDVRAELAPRDIVARAIANEGEKNGLGYVHLDISHQPSDFVRHHFPDIYAHCLTVGIDMTTDSIPVAPTAHYTCGGVMTTSKGQTDVVGLYAAGEVAHTGLHGANRLASNSLLECVVVGRDIATHLPNYLAGQVQWQQPDSYTSEGSHTTTLSPVSISSFKVSLKEVDAININACNLDKSIRHPLRPDSQIRAELKKLMTDNMGIKREQRSLTNALAQVTAWQQQLSHLDISKDKNRISDDKNPIERISVFQTQRLLKLASLLLHSAHARLESRGGHYRKDYPTSLKTPAISIIDPVTADAAKISKYEHNTVDLTDTEGTSYLIAI